MTWPLVPVDGKRGDWFRLAAQAINYLLGKVDGVTGMKDTANSTTTPLGSGETFTGAWVQNDHAQLAFNCKADADGELFVEFSIDGTDALTTLSKRYEVFADQGEFDALVKMPGRFHRVRFVNGGTAQTSFGLIVSTANDGLFPFSLSDRDAPKFAASNGSAIGAESYRILVDLSDRTNYPHNRTGRVDLHSAFFFVDKAANTVGAVQIGVITRIDGTNADISFVQGISFNSTSDRSFSRDRVFQTPISCGQDSGALTQVATGFKVTTASVNTSGTLATQFGTATPAVGDLVARFNYTSGGNYDAAVSVQYSTSSSVS